MTQIELAEELAKLLRETYIGWLNLNRVNNDLDELLSYGRRGMLLFTSSVLHSEYICIDDDCKDKFIAEAKNNHNRVLDQFKVFGKTEKNNNER